MVELTEKEIAMREVIAKRVSIIRNNVLPNVKEEALAEYYEGKIDGLMQGYELLGESFESIKIEL